MLQKEIKYSLDDVVIQPIATSFIEHRHECDPFYKNDILPLFTAPMSSVVNDKNYETFIKNGITPIIPRTVSYGKRLSMCVKGNLWVAFSMYEFEETFIKNEHSVDNINKFTLIDIANGHMDKLAKLITCAKSKHGTTLTIMVGNIANPETYRILSMAGADYIRVGIGNGKGCLTSSNLGINYPMASLIDECYKIKCCETKTGLIIADGGIRGYSDIIKSLALGADFVMCGSLFNKMLESAAFTYITPWSGVINGKEINYTFKKNYLNFEDYKTYYEANAPVYKEFYGMSTKKAQKLMGKEKLSTSEGKVIEQKVEYYMEQWVENFIDYLRSAMSYCGVRSLNDFIGETKLNVITNNAFNSFNK